MVTCLACNSGTKLFLKDSKFSIYRCPKCGLGFTQDVKDQANDYHRDCDYIKNQKRFENIYAKRVNIIAKHISKPGKVLEIGSSTGLMLSLFKRRGWEVLGIEVSKKAAEFARERGIPTLITSFEVANLPTNSFDVVVLNHALEHLRDPQEVFKKIKALLTKDGLLFIDVPNFDGLSAKVYGKKWPYLLPNEHLWHFTFPALKKILEKNNFKIIFNTQSSGIWDYQNPILELWQSFSTFKKRFFSNLFTAIPTLFISKFDLGSGLIILAKKK